MSRRPAWPRRRGSVPRRRQTAGAVVGASVLTLLTLAAVAARGTLPLAGDALLYLLAVVVIAAVGGFWPALGAAVASSLLLNWFFTEPLHTLTIAAPENVLGLVVFLVVALIVSRLVDVAARRTSEAHRAAREADTVRNFVLQMVSGADLTDLLATVRVTFGVSGAALLRRTGGPGPEGRTPAWVEVAASGPEASHRPDDAAATVAVDTDLVLVLAGDGVGPGDRRLLAALAAQLGVAHREAELRRAAEAAAPLAANDRARTALLNAVSHDLRTPIAAAKTAVSSLRSRDVAWSEADRAELLATTEEALDRLTDLVTNLLDMSRLEAGLLPVLAAPVGVDEVVARALDHVDGGDAVTVDLPAALPAVRADAGLLERVIANVVGNGVRYAPAGRPLLVTARVADDRVRIGVVDHGPGIAAPDLEAVFEPFRRRDDRPVAGAGVGLGLAIARGFLEAMGGTITAGPTPGGGTTMVLDLPAATARSGTAPAAPAAVAR